MLPPSLDYNLDALVVRVHLDVFLWWSSYGTTRRCQKIIFGPPWSHVQSIRISPSLKFSTTNVVSIKTIGTKPMLNLLGAFSTNYFKKISSLDGLPIKYWYLNRIFENNKNFVYIASTITKKIKMKMEKRGKRYNLRWNFFYVFVSAVKENSFFGSRIVR